MRDPMKRCVSVMTTAIALGVVSATAQAQPSPARAACIAASDQGQSARDAGKLRAARTAFLACSKAECPKTVRLDCDGWVQDVNKSLPTVVLQITDAHGAEVTDARVSFDGEPLVDHLTGSAIPVDPGSHMFGVTLASGEKTEQRVVIREAERARALVIAFPMAPGASRPPGSAAAVVAPLPPPPAERKPTSTNLVVGSIAGALGLASLGAAIYFETQQASKGDALVAQCPHGCPTTPTLQSQVNTVHSDQTLEGVFFGVSGVALAAAAYVLIGRPFRSAEPAPAAASSFEIAPGLHGAAARWSLRF